MIARVGPALTSDDLLACGSPEGLAGTVAFLASHDSDFITGQAIVVDGGAVFH